MNFWLWMVVAAWSGLAVGVLVFPFVVVAKQIPSSLIEDLRYISVNAESPDHGKDCADLATNLLVQMGET